MARRLPAGSPPAVVGESTIDRRERTARTIGQSPTDQRRLDSAPLAVESHRGESGGIMPLEVTLGGENALWSRRLTQATWAFVALGVAMRVVRFLLRWPLWGDESFVAANFLDRGYLDLLQPLEYHMVCPLLFLWVELFLVKLCGYSEYSLRLFPFVTSVASLFVFRHAAARLLRGAPLLLAVAIFAVSYYPMRHGAEVKPYAADLFAALVLTALAIEMLHKPQSTLPLWGLVVTTPLALAVSYPAVFVAGGVAAALLPVVWRRHALRFWLPYIAWGVALVGTFVALFMVFTARQYAVESSAGTMTAVWAEAFPPLAEPLKLARWFVETHTGLMFAYPLGGKHGASSLSFICAVVAIVALGWHRKWNVLGILLAPVPVAFVAAALQRYPYGGSTRVMLYLAPTICLLVGLGATVLLSWGRRQWFRRGGFAIAVLLLAVIGGGTLLRDLAVPYKTLWDYNEQGFARWFWHDLAHDAELVCVKADLGQDFFPHHYEWGRSALYLCNQRIYSARHQAGRAPDWDRVSAEHPLRCVIYSVPDFPRDETKFARWLNEMRQKWVQTGYQKYRLGPGLPMFDELFEVYEFVPCPSVAAETSPRHDGRRTR